VPENAPKSEKKRTAAVYLALGSNVGDRQANLHGALRLLNESAISVVKSSSLYETEPLDYLDQGWFLNSAVEAHTQCDPLDLLRTLREIEKRMGSKKPFAKGPRLIDLDILLYDHQTIDLPELQVPHPRMLERRFVLVPLAEIAPELRHPSWPGNVVEMLARTSDHSEVRKFLEGSASC
jgi:2-amino-4-hydroxy-6-hydroxymethyldihydropteridine diphosphokinase